MRAKQMWRSGVLVLALVSALGCSGSRDAGHPSSEPSAPATAPATEAPPATQTSPSTETPPATQTSPSAETPPPSDDCPGICYHELPTGGCESMPTCCPKTVRLKAPPHCPADYTLDLKSGPERCAVRHLCMD